MNETLFTVPQTVAVLQLPRLRIYELIRQNRFPGVVRVRLDPRRGVYARPGTGSAEQWVCSPLRVLALARSSEHEQRGYQLEFVDSDRIVHEFYVSAQQLVTDFNGAIGPLVSEGLKISGTRQGKQALVRYIQTRQTKKRVRCVSKAGWHGRSYVLRSATIQPAHAEELVLQASYQSKLLTNTKGSVHEWKGACAHGLARSEERIDA